MNLDEDELKLMWQETIPTTNEDKALKKVLEKSSKVTAAKDVTGLFLGWIWVVFLGFGASMYSAKRKFDLHNQSTLKKRNVIKQSTTTKYVTQLNTNTGDLK
ncbi:hypothetical protein ACM9HF_14170 [Colwellia sp. RE-S-Sl-9]